MNLKVLIISILFLAALIFGVSSFMESNIEYGKFNDAMNSQKNIRVKGEWVKDKPTSFDIEKGLFLFYMKDDDGNVMPVVFDGVKPNNFEIANSIVVKGKYKNNQFYASEILTKCPSKYEINSN